MPDRTDHLMVRTRHDHLERGCLAEDDPRWNMPSHEDYEINSIIRCRDCGTLWRNAGYTWKRVSERRARRLARKLMDKKPAHSQRTEWIEDWLNGG